MTNKIVDHIVRHHEDHPSRKHIKKNITPPPSPRQEVKKILKELSTEKSAGVDTTPPKLVKFAANYLAGPLSQSINNSIKKGCFPKMQRLPQLLP